MINGKTHFLMYQNVSLLLDPNPKTWLDPIVIGLNLGPTGEPFDVPVAGELTALPALVGGFPVVAVRSLSCWVSGDVAVVSFSGSNQEFDILTATLAAGLKNGLKSVDLGAGPVPLTFDKAGWQRDYPIHVWPAVEPCQNVDNGGNPCPGGGIRLTSFKGQPCEVVGTPA